MNEPQATPPIVAATAVPQSVAPAEKSQPVTVKPILRGIPLATAKVIVPPQTVVEALAAAPAVAKPVQPVAAPRKNHTITAKAKRPAPVRPAGWWALPAFAGTRDAVVKTIAASNIPDYWKAALTSRLAALDANYNFIKLDAHYVIGADGRENLHLTLIPSSVLL
jgi:hypothetical protein